MSAITFDDWQAIIKKVGKQAKAGDAAARRFLAEYLIGKPVQEVKLDAHTDLAIILNWDDDNSDADSAETA